MIAELKPYPAMKDSGVLWLGKVPEHWEVRRNGRLFRQRNQAGFGHLPILEVSISTGVRVRDVEAPDRKQVMSDREKYKRAAKGDIAYNMMRMWQGAVGVAPVDGLVSPAYVVAEPFTEAYAQYFERVFRTGSYMSEVNKFSRGIVSDRNRLYWEDFKQITSPFPPPSDQALIVRFLDHVDRRTRRYILAKQRLIKLLEEQKQAVIHGAVTRGLDPNVRLKSSGVEWLGDVPEHWGVRRIASFSSKITNGWVGPTRDILRDQGARYIQSLHIKRGEIHFAKKYFVDNDWLNAHAKIQLREGDVLVVQTGDIGQTACVPRDFDGAGCHALIIIRTEPRVIGGAFLDLVLRSRYGFDSLKSVQTGALHPHLNCTWVREIFVPVPPISEQVAILSCIVETTMGLNRAIADAEREIELLREYRSRLIADVVTGKLDVREAAAQLPDEAEEPVPLDEAEALDEADEDSVNDLDAAPEEAEA
jgi:type I restriction enzyme S subunit